MAHGLSLLLKVKTPGFSAVGQLAEALQGGNGDVPRILHYFWLVPLGTTNNDGSANYLLTTVYDENFASYIRDLVLANPAPFNAAANFIVGLEGLTPVQDPKNLPRFIDFVRQNDLTKGGTTPFNQTYPYTVVQIQEALG